MSKIFLGQPCYGAIEFESADAVDNALNRDSPHELTAVRLTSSLLANCFNQLLAICLNAGGYDYWALLHGDMAPADGFLDTLVAELEMYRLDVIHAPCALKSEKGYTSTAMAYSDDPWQPVRRLTVRELKSLWPTFTIGILREQLDPAARILLPNTGCMLIRIGDWLKKFPGFEIRDRMLHAPGAERLGVRYEFQPQCVSEDWNFGYWCAAHGVKVGGTTKVATRHVGRMVFPSDKDWGRDRDEDFFELRDAA
jgi:hypothetical protein